MNRYLNKIINEYIDYKPSFIEELKTKTITLYDEFLNWR